MARSTSSPVAASGTCGRRGAGAFARPATCSSRCVRASGPRTCSSSPACCSAAGCSTRRRVARRRRPRSPSSARSPASSISSTTSPIARAIGGTRSRRSGRSPPARCRCRSAAGVAASCSARRRWPARVRARAGASRPSRSPTWRCRSLYSGPLKHIVIIDVLTIAIGFVLRAVGRRGGGRRRDQPLAARLHDSAGAVHRARQAAPRARPARRRRDRAIGRSSASTARTCSIR